MKSMFDLMIIDWYWWVAAAAAVVLISVPLIIRRRRRANGEVDFSAVARGQLEYIDQMDGVQFEHFIASMLQRLGYGSVDLTCGSHDQGVDVLAEREGVRFAIQCKNYDSNLGNSAVQEVVAGREYYRCHVGVVVTNSYFTRSAVELAAANRVLLWDRNVLAEMIDKLDL